MTERRPHRLPGERDPAAALDQMIPIGPAGRVVEQFGDPPPALLVDEKRHRPAGARDLGSPHACLARHEPLV